MGKTYLLLYWRVIKKCSLFCFVSFLEHFQANVQSPVKVLRTFSMSAFIELTFPTKTVYAVYISRRTLLYFSYSFNSIQFILQQKDPASSVALLESRRPLTHENFMKRSFFWGGGWGLDIFYCQGLVGKRTEHRFF